jgi:proline iminopeptidase
MKSRAVAAFSFSLKSRERCGSFFSEAAPCRGFSISRGSLTMTTTDEYVTTEDGVRLFAQKLGNGPNAVLIPNRVYLFDAFKVLAADRTLIFWDPRNRGRSDHVSDRSKLGKGIHHDVSDLEAVRRHFDIARVDLIGHSYMGLAVILYAMKYPDHVGRVVQIGAMAPDYARQYPAYLTNVDATLGEVLARLGELQKERQAHDPKEFCRKFWALLRVLYVVDAADADKLKWEPCDLPNEMNYMKQWNEDVLPSIQNLNLTEEEISKAKAPVLAIHGRQDRSSSYGGGRDWVSRLPDARLVTVENAAHVPWIEDPVKVFGAVETFLGGAWPETAETVE